METPPLAILLFLLLITSSSAAAAKASSLKCREMPTLTNLSLYDPSKWWEQKHFHKLQNLDDETFKELASPEESLPFEDVLDNFLTTRVPGTPSHKKVKKYIIGQMESLGWTVGTDKFEDKTPYGKKKFENIIATLHPGAQRTLVLACHYDSKLFEDFEFIAATDSAVPCAMLIHMAHTLKKSFDVHRDSEEPPAVTLQFIFFDGEEAFKEWTSKDSLYGSRHLASKWEKEAYPKGNKDGTKMLHRIDVLVLLDLLGTANETIRLMYDNTKDLYQTFVQLESELKGTSNWEGTESPIFKSEKYPGEVEDDHIPFVRKCVRILHLITLPFPEAWHTEDDNLVGLHLPTISNLNKILRMFVVAYLRGEQDDEGAESGV